MAAPRRTLTLNICLKNKNGLLFDSLSIAETFKKYYSLVENLVLKLPKPPNNFGRQSGKNYYKKCNLNKRLLFSKMESDKVFKVLKNFDESKAPGIDDLSGIFLKDYLIISHANNTAMQSDNFFR